MSELDISGDTREAGWDAFMQAVKTTNDMPQIYARTLHAVAPLAVADELQRLMDEALPDEDSDYHYGCEALLDLVRDRIPELRGVRKAGA